MDILSKKLVPVTTVSALIILSSTSLFSGTVAYSEPGQTLLTFVANGSDNSTSSGIAVTLHQGESASVALIARIADGYNVLSIEPSIDNLPPGVAAWVVPNQIPQLNGSRPDNDVALSIFVDSDARAGNYTLAISGQGIIQNKATGQNIQVIKDQNGTLAEIHLTVLLAINQPIKLGIGQPDFHRKQMCIENGPPGGGETCAGFVGYEEFPVTVFVQNNATHTLPSNTSIAMSAINVPHGTWLKFIPDHFTLTKSSTAAQNITGKIIIAGAVKPFGSFPPDTKELVIDATAVSNGLEEGSGSAFLPYLVTENMTILHSPEDGPITFPDERPIPDNINGTNFGYYGVVYDPQAGFNATGTLPVSLSVSGIAKEKGGQIQTVPSWLHVDIPTTSFTLNTSEPYYFLIKTETSMAPVGNYYIAVNEIIGQASFQRHFMAFAPLSVNPPIYLGPAGQEAAAPEFPASVSGIVMAAAIIGVVVLTSLVAKRFSWPQ